MNNIKRFKSFHLPYFITRYQHDSPKTMSQLLNPKNLSRRRSKAFSVSSQLRRSAHPLGVPRSRPTSSTSSRSRRISRIRRADSNLVAIHPAFTIQRDDSDPIAIRPASARSRFATRLVRTHQLANSLCFWWSGSTLQKKVNLKP